MPAGRSLRGHHLPHKFSSIVALTTALGMAFAESPAVAGSTAAQTPATASMTTQRSAAFQRLQDLDFAWLTVANAGRATVDPDNDALTTTGGVTYLTGTARAAAFSVTSPSKTKLRIEVPKGSINVVRVGGTETMKVDTWKLSGKKDVDLDPNQVLLFKIGATLHVNANQAEGLYVGTFDVEVQYR